MATKVGHIIFAIDSTETNGASQKGYRLLKYKVNSENNTWEFMRGFVSEPELIKALKKGLTIDNCELKDGQLHGKTGSLSRFYSNQRMKMKTLVIISEMRLGDSSNKLIGYKVVARDGSVRNIKVQDLLNFCKMAPPDLVPVQNAVYVSPSDNTSSGFIRGFYENQFYIEHVSITAKAPNVSPAKVNTSENSKQIKASDVFNPEQLQELNLGKQSGVNIRIYGNKNLSAEQMREIRFALESGLDPRPYADPRFSADCMRAYRIQSKYGVDIRRYVNPKYNRYQIFTLGTAVLDHVDVARIADPNMTVEQMEKARIEMVASLWQEYKSVSVLDILKDMSILKQDA